MRYILIILAVIAICTAAIIPAFAEVDCPDDGINGIVPGTCIPPPPKPVPEFPTLALPVGIIIGMIGIIYALRTKNYP